MIRKLACKTPVFLALLSVPLGADAQQFQDFCPTGDAETEAAVVGYVTDPDEGTVVPGATVSARWLEDGTRQRVEAQSGLDGLFALCGLPQDAEVELRAAFGDRRGKAVPYTTSAVLAQHDLEVSLAEAAADEELEISEHARTGRAFSADVINEEDLAALPEMSLYQLLRRHQRLRFERFSGGEVILLDQVRRTSVNAGRFRGVQLYVDERREADPVSVLRTMSTDEVKQIQILTASEASARYGGDGYIGVLAIRTRDR